MLAVLLLGYSSDSASLMQEFHDELLAAGHDTDLDMSVHICHYDEVRFEFVDDMVTVTDGRNEQPLEAYDLVIFKGAMKVSHLPYAVNRYLRLKKVPHFNDYGAYRRIGKLAQSFDLIELGLPMPRTMYVGNKQLLQQAIARDWEFPLCLKPIDGSKGANNFLARTSAEVQSILTEHPDVRFMVQEYIPNDGDYRVLVIGDQELVLERRAQAGSHLNNTSQGAASRVLASTILPRQIIRQAHVLAQHLSMDVAGVDVLPDKRTGKFYFLEINAQPRLGSAAAYKLLAELLQKRFTKHT